MAISANHRRVILALLLAGVASTTFASLSEAGHGRWRRYRGHHHPVIVRHVHHPVVVCAPRPSYVSWHSHPGAAFAGFVGGVVVGATLASPPPVTYAYWDVDCGRSFASIEYYNRHSRMGFCGGHVRAIAIPDGYRWDELHGCPDCGVSFWGEYHECE